MFFENIGRACQDKIARCRTCLPKRCQFSHVGRALTINFPYGYTEISALPHVDILTYPFFAWQVEQESERIGKDAVECQVIADDAQADLAVAMPALEKAMAEVDKLDKTSITEVNLSLQPVRTQHDSCQSFSHSAMSGLSLELLAQGN